MWSRRRTDSVPSVAMALVAQSRPILQYIPLPLLLRRRLLLGTEESECTVVVGCGRMLRIQHFLLPPAFRFTHTWYPVSFRPGPSPFRPPLRSFRYTRCPVESCKCCLLLCRCRACYRACDESERKLAVLGSDKESDGPFSIIFLSLCGSDM
jgi:hypothetical protein